MLLGALAVSFITILLLPITMNLFYKISIDRAKANYISGWCFYRFARLKKVDLELYLGEKLIAETKAEIFREDLQALGVHPTGECGFEMIFDHQLDIAADAYLELRSKHSRIPLAKIAINGFVVQEPMRLKQWFRLLSSKSSIIFMHIPKTAGTSFNILAQSILSRDGFVSHAELINNTKIPELQKTNRYISGHIRIGLIKKYFALDKAALYTIIREPYAHLNSHMNWLITTYASSDDNYFKYNNPIIYDIGRDLSKYDFTSIENLHHFVHDISELHSAFFDNMQTRYFLDNEINSVNRQHLTEAKANLKLFTLVGLTEDYATFVQDFMETNGFKIPQLDKKLNISKSSPLFDDHNKTVREILYPLVRFDLELYRHIKQMNQK